MTVGKVGGRGLPLVAADLLKFNLGARRYAGCPAELAISEPPPQPEAKPDPLRLLAKKAAGKVGNAVKAARRHGRRPFRPHSWFGKGRRRKDAGDQQFRPQESRHRKPWGRFLAVAALGLLAVVLLPSSALADDPDDNPYGDAWRLGEIYFEPPDPVPGRRVYVERLAVSGNTAAVTLRAAHDLDLKGRVFGGRTGRTLKMGFNTGLAGGPERKSYNLTLDGPSPSFTFSWQDALGFSGAASLKSHQIPYPLPTAEGELCDLEVTSLEWTPGRITGVIASQCITETRHEEDLPVYGGHFSQSVPAMLDADVTGIAGTVSVAMGRPLHHGDLRPGRRDFLHPARGQQPGGQRPGDHGGPDGDAERPPAAHVADRPPPGPHRRVHPPGDLHLRRKLDGQDGAHLRPPPGARAGGGEPARSTSPAPGRRACPLVQASNAAPSGEPRVRRPLPGPLRAPAQAPAAEGGTDPGGRFQLVELAMARKLTAILLSSAAALASVAAAPDDEMNAMTAAFDAALTGMAYVGAGLCFFGIVWAGFLLMAEGAEGENRGRARNAVFMAVVGLVVVLLAKGIAAGIIGRIIEVLPGA